MSKKEFCKTKQLDNRDQESLRFLGLFTKQAVKDIKSLSPKFQQKLKRLLLEVISKNPYSGKKLLGDFNGNYSYRLNLKDRIVYSIDKKAGRIYVKRARTNYEKI